MNLVKKWVCVKDQMCNIGKCHWSVPRLHQLAKDLPVMEIPLEHITMTDNYASLCIRDFVMHMDAVMSADLRFPIILDEDGEIMDGRHRLMRALHERKETIKAVRFEENPSPCRHDDG